MIRKATEKDLDSVVRIYESVLSEDEKRDEKMVGWVSRDLSYGEDGSGRAGTGVVVRVSGRR